MNYQNIAAAMLADVGLTFDDVVDTGRPWEWRTPFGVSVERNSDRKYTGRCLGHNSSNPTSRQRHLIELSGPVDCEFMLFILAHECGHVSHRHCFSSLPVYWQEYQAEIYAIKAFSIHVGRWPHPFFICRAKKYVREHCWNRQYHNPDSARIRGWNGAVLEWCGFVPQIGEIY